MQILIPMAGAGTKFKKAGYKTHHAALPTFDRHTCKKLPMVVCAASDLPGIEENGRNIIFVDRLFHKENGVEEKIKRFFPGAKFITLRDLTDGQAATCLHAKDYINADDELLIASADNGMVCNIDYFNVLRYECDVIVFTCRHNEVVLQDPNAYGWMIIDNSNNITGVSVKKTISQNPMEDHAVVSSFWFRNAHIFFQAAEMMILNNDRINNEFYVDEVIKYVMKLGYHAKVFEIDRYIGWGTPNDYENYQLTFDYWLGFIDKIDTRKFIIPFTIGIAGDSGAGKSTLLNMVKKVTGNDNVLILEGDGDHKWERNSTEWQKYTHLNIDANNIYAQADNLELLKNGSAVKRHEYDHRTGTFSKEFINYPKPYVILCGLHSFYLPKNRRNLDLKIYMDVDEKLKIFWKLKRDIYERGHKLDEVFKQIEYRRKDAVKFVEPQKDYADFRIHYYDSNLVDYTDFSYEEKVNVDVEFKKEDVICGVVHRMFEYLSFYFDEVTYNSNVISFSEDGMKNKMIPIGNICQKLDIDTSCFAITEQTKIKGKDGILALVLIAYICEKKQYD